MTASERISKDLAVVARASRERPVSLEATLRAVGASPTSQSTMAGDIALVTMSRLFATRVARIATGLAALVFVVARIVYVLIPASTPYNNPERLDELSYRLLWTYPTPDSPLRIAAIAALVYLVSFAASARVFRRNIMGSTDPRAAGTALVMSVESWSSVIAIASIATFAIADLAQRLLFDGEPLLWLQSEGTPAWTERDALVYSLPLVAPILMSWLLAPLIARKFADFELGRSTSFFALVAASLGGVLYLAGPLDLTNSNALAHAAGFAVTMMIATVAFALFVVARQQRERGLLGEDAS